MDHKKYYDELAKALYENTAAINVNNNILKKVFRLNLEPEIPWTQPIRVRSVSVSSETFDTVESEPESYHNNQLKDLTNVININRPQAEVPITPVFANLGLSSSSSQDEENQPESKSSPSQDVQFGQPGPRQKPEEAVREMKRQELTHQRTTVSTNETSHHKSQNSMKENPRKEMPHQRSVDPNKENPRKEMPHQRSVDPNKENPRKEMPHQRSVDPYKEIPRKVITYQEAPRQKSGEASGKSPKEIRDKKPVQDSKESHRKRTMDKEPPKDKPSSSRGEKSRSSNSGNLKRQEVKAKTSRDKSPKHNPYASRDKTQEDPRKRRLESNTSEAKKRVKSAYNVPY